MSLRTLLHPRSAIVVACLALFSGLEPARAQQPEALLHRRAELTDRIHSLRQARPGYARSDQVARLQEQLREAQTRFLERRNQLNQQLREHASQPAESNAGKADELLGTIQKLQDEKKRALRDLRAGLFCSECKRTKTEIEATGEPFDTHLGRVEGHAIPASPELIAEKMAEFDAKIDRLQEELARLRQRDLESQRGREESETKLRRELAALDIEEREALAAIRRAIGDARAEERSAANDEEARWLDEVRVAEDELQEVELEIDRLRDESPRSSPPRPNPNDDLPDQWLDANAGVAFVRFGSASGTDDDALADRDAWPEPYAGPDDDPWAPVETGEFRPVDFSDETAAIRELLGSGGASAVEPSSGPPAFAAADTSEALLAKAGDVMLAERWAVRALLLSRSKLELAATAGASAIVHAAPAAIEAIEDEVHRELSPGRRFEREAMTRVKSAWTFAIGGFLRWMDNWHQLALKSIPRYVDKMDTYPEYSGTDDQ